MFAVLVVPSMLSLQGCRVTYETIQRREDSVESGTVLSISLPTLQHQSVEDRRATVRSGKTILINYCLHYLETEKWGKK